jgi:NAD(P)H-flavin reductase
MEVIESRWLREFTSRSFDVSSRNSTSPTPPQRDPRLAKLVEGILYSRRLILTYHFVILGFVVLLTVVHWTRKILRWKKRRCSKLRGWTLQKPDIDNLGTRPLFCKPNSQEIKSISSSSCSTIIDGSASPPRKDVDEDEESPLLLRHDRSLPFSQRSLISSFQAVWMYQPPPIPVVNKILPANGTSFVVLAFVALNLFYTFYHINFNLFELFVLADRCGLVFVANIPLLYLLAAKTQPLRVLTGRSYESLNIFHRRLGELLCLEAFLHFGGMIGAWYILIRPNGFGLVRFLLLKMCLLGLGAFFAYQLLYFTSLASFRQRWYELFLYFHIVLQVAALVFVFFHHPSARWYVGIALTIFLVDRLVYRLGIKRTKIVEAETKILEDEETVRLSSIVTQHPISIFSSIFGHSVKTGWKATDHVFITVPSLSAGHIVQAHPFTIASPPPRPEDTAARMELLIRAQNGFSRDLLNAARLHKHLSLRLDGPYGSSHARDMLEDSDLALLVAGGSGIAVCWPLVHHLLDGKLSPDVEIGTKFSDRKLKIILIWVIHEGTHLSWLGRPALADADYRGVEIIIPRATEEVGRPDIKSMINELVQTYASGKNNKIRVVASGPDSMGRVVRNTCATLVRHGKDVDVAIEKFGW